MMTLHVNIYFSWRPMQKSTNEIAISPAVSMQNAC